MARILIVEDELAIREFIRMVLTSHNHNVDTAADGVEAVEAVRKTKYDVVFMDWKMPRMGGIQALAIIRANPKCQNVKVIMCTLASLTKEVEEAFAAGANDYILKPFNVEMLLAKVQKALGQA